MDASLFIKPSRITDIQDTPFASGGAADVFRARYDGERVVIKRIKNSCGAPALIKDFMNEVTTLSKLNHSRIVRFFGVLQENDGCISLVLEVKNQRYVRIYICQEMTHGSLMGYYQQHPKPHVSDRILWSLDIARGMQYLHDRSPQIIHRDLKSLNVLISKDNRGILRAKVSDFGSAVLQLSTSSQRKSNYPCLNGTTPFYRAPELKGIRLKFTTATDVYAYGIILSELASWEGPFACPWSDLDHHAVLNYINRGESVPINLDDCDVPETFKNLIMRCTGASNDRPTSNDIIKSLNDMLSDDSPLSPLFEDLETYIPIASDSAFTEKGLQTQRNYTENGIYFGKDPEADVKWCLYLAESGNAEAQNRLANHFYSGQGVEKNTEEAIRWYIKSADQGNSWGQFKEIQLRSFGQAKGIIVGADSVFRLGYCYEKGLGVKESVEIATKWYKLSAAGSHLGAQRRLDWLIHGSGETNASIS
ncbi:hypothetical protein HDU97_003948 [Phlyctochytrium planicorne]|nr:hypothetical protein HDU97_003948 [Phlyctochytrium planicorne]